MKNPNLSVAEAFVSELARAGVREVCLAPGSRSTPLALAFDAHPDIQVYVHLDERCAAFYALGLALALDRPVPVVCTSGSAAANFFPAIVEARMSRLPLLLLTADRPPELRQSGANQTIDQLKLYGDQVLWTVDLPVPEENLPDLALRHVRTLAARAYATANGLEKGPVHLNFPFRKPLEPTSAQDAPAFEPLVASFTRISHGVIAPTAEQIAALADSLQQHPHGLIVCGPRCPGGDFPQAVYALAQHLGYPLLADPLSGVRFGFPDVIGGYDGFLAAGKTFDPAPQVILRFGGVPTSAALNAYLAKIQPAERILINEHGGWADDDHRTTWLLQADPALTCYQVTKCLAGYFVPSDSTLAQPDSLTPTPPPQGEGYKTPLSQQERGWGEGEPSQASERISVPLWHRARNMEKAYWLAVRHALAASPWFDGAALAAVLELAPADACLFVGNSLAVRNLDTFGAPGEKRLTVYGSRGASGIDGNVSTALGIAAADRTRPLLALLGDLTLYHDLNGLLALRRHSLDNVTIILFNNHGGGIFHQLPVSRFDPPFRELFLTPESLDFAHAAALYGLDHHLAPDRSALLAALSAPWLSRPPRLVEIPTDSEEDHRCRKDVIKNITTETQSTQRKHE